MNPSQHLKIIGTLQTHPGECRHSCIQRSTFCTAPQFSPYHGVDQHVPNESTPNQQAASKDPGTAPLGVFCHALCLSGQPQAWMLCQGRRDVQGIGSRALNTLKLLEAGRVRANFKAVVTEKKLLLTNSNCSFLLTHRESFIKSPYKNDHFKTRSIFHSYKRRLTHWVHHPRTSKGWWKSFGQLHLVLVLESHLLEIPAPSKALWKRTQDWNGIIYISLQDTLLNPNLSGQRLFLTYL